MMRRQEQESSLRSHAVVVAFLTLSGVSSAWGTELPSAPLLVTSYKQCEDFARQCFAVIEERRLAFHDCTSGVDASRGQYRDVSFASCPDAAYKAYTPPVCDTQAENFQCGTSWCRATIQDCRDRAALLGADEEKEEDEPQDLYSQIFGKGKKWHDAQLRARKMDSRSKSVIRQIVEKNMSTIEAQHRALLIEADRAAKKLAADQARQRARPPAPRRETATGGEQQSASVSAYQPRNYVDVCGEYCGDRRNSSSCSMSMEHAAFRACVIQSEAEDAQCRREFSACVTRENFVIRNGTYVDGRAGQ